MILVVDPSDSATFPTIQAAIDAAADGDTISIAAGTYTECLDLGGRSLTLHGAATLTGASACAADSAIVATRGETLVLRGLTLHNPSGRAVEVDGGALTLDGVTVADIDNTAAYLPGAAASVTDGTLIVTGSTFSNLRAAEGGALYARDTDVSIASSTFTSTYASYFGGAVELYSHGDEKLQVTGTTFQGSEVGGYAGSAIYAWTSDGADAHTTTVTIDTTSFVGSVAGTDAGALALGDIDEATITDCSFDMPIRLSHGPERLSLEAWGLPFDLNEDFVQQPEDFAHLPFEAPQAFAMVGQRCLNRRDALLQIAHVFRQDLHAMRGAFRKLAIGELVVRVRLLR